MKLWYTRRMSRSSVCGGGHQYLHMRRQYERGTSSKNRSFCSSESFAEPSLLVRYSLVRCSLTSARDSGIGLNMACDRRTVHRLKKGALLPRLRTISCMLPMKCLASWCSTCRCQLGLTFRSQSSIRAFNVDEHVLPLPFRAFWIQTRRSTLSPIDLCDRRGLDD